jgi:hypothetical protein
MALGEQIMLDKAGPQFTYEIRWESDMSTSIIRPNEVAVRMVRPALRCPLLLLLYLSTPVAWHVDVVTSRTQPHTATWPDALSGGYFVHLFVAMVLTGGVSDTVA